ncbi:MAG: NUDIX hydrolase [Gemmataceae bacterium]
MSNSEEPFDLTPQQINHEILFRGRYVQLARTTASRPDGSLMQREVVLHPGAVAILPFLDDGRVCLVRNQRLAVGKTLIEIPAGTLEPGEVPEKTAIRELAEETGYRAEEWQKLSVFYPSPGTLSEATHLFVAKKLTAGPTDIQPDEDLESVIVEWSELLQWVLEGTIQDAKTIVAVMLWKAQNGD